MTSALNRTFVFHPVKQGFASLNPEIHEFFSKVEEMMGNDKIKRMSISPESIKQFLDNYSEVDTHNNLIHLREAIKDSTDPENLQKDIMEMIRSQ